MRRQVSAFVTADIIREYQETCEELTSRYPSKPALLPLNLIIAACEMTEPRSRVTVCRDPEDNKFIECAVEAKCVFVVSGDKDLLTVKKYRDIQIVTVAEFLDSL